MQKFLYKISSVLTQFVHSLTQFDQLGGNGRKIFQEVFLLPFTTEYKPLPND